MNHIFTTNDKTFPIVIRKHPKSRRMVIRYQPLQHHLCLTLPRYVSIRQGLHFVEEKRAWIERQIDEQPEHIPFTDGQVIPFHGTDYTLTHKGGRGVISIEDEKILVPGDKQFMERRVREWLKEKAREEITALAKKDAALIGKKIKKITVRDTSSRWGSCSHDGSLSFSWRLILAPDYVLKYLVSHEVAHLAELNHSPAFWAIVKELCPEYDQARRWLKTYGQRLYSYG